jgi:hypothetical protein
MCFRTMVSASVVALLMVARGLGAECHVSAVADNGSTVSAKGRSVGAAKVSVVGVARNQSQTRVSGEGRKPGMVSAVGQAINGSSTHVSAAADRSNSGSKPVTGPKHGGGQKQAQNCGHQGPRAKKAAVGPAARGGIVVVVVVEAPVRGVTTPALRGGPLSRDAVTVIARATGGKIPTGDGRQRTKP